MLTKWSVIFLTAATTWAYLFSEQALAILVEFKRQIRLRIIRQTGAAAVKDLAHHLNRFAAQNGIETELVEEVLAENHDLIIERLGSKYADEILGEPGPSERTD